MIHNQRLSVLFLMLAAIFALSYSPASAHHGWTTYDLFRPVYLSGTVKELIWQNPHVEVFLEVPADLQLPADLTQIAVPEPLARVGGKDTLLRTRLPGEPGKTWELELAPIARMAAYGVQRDELPEAGGKMSVIAYISRINCDEARVELIILEDGTPKLQRNSALPPADESPNPCNPEVVAVAPMNLGLTEAIVLSGLAASIALAVLIAVRR